MSLSANHLRDLLVVFLPAIHDVVNANYFTLFYFLKKNANYFMDKNFLQIGL